MERYEEVAAMFKVRAMIHSMNKQDEALILHEKGANDVVAEYKGIRCTAIYNPFSGLFYVDDIFGVLPDQNKCPSCGEYLE